MGGYAQLLRFVRMGGVAWRGVGWCDAITLDPLSVSPSHFSFYLSSPIEHARGEGGRDTRSAAVRLSVYAPRINAFPDATPSE